MKTLQAEMKEDRNKSEGKPNKNFGPSNAWGSIASVDNLSQDEQKLWNSLQKRNVNGRDQSPEVLVLGNERQKGKTPLVTAGFNVAESLTPQKSKRSRQADTYKMPHKTIQ